jgi:hypothetical protein
MSLAIDTADAVVTELDGGSFSLAFTPERRYLPILRPEDMGEDLHVSVLMRGKDYEIFSRKDSERDIKIDVAVQKKYETEENAELDPLMELAEEIADFFEKKKLSNGARCVKVDHDPIYVPQHMMENRIFTSIVTLTLRAYVVVS